MRDRPHPNHKLEWPGGIVPEWARPKKNPNKRFGKKGGKNAGKRERLQKVMAQSGYGSRRNIEILIAQGHLTINGEVAKLGDSVGPGDKVKLDGNVITLRFGAELPRVLLYHKPDNEIVTRDDPEGRATVFEKLPKVKNGHWVSVGRLDLNTSGLLIFTTSGDLANKLTHPRFEVEREYAVRVMGELTEEQKDKLLNAGVDIDGETCKFDSIEERGGDGANRWYHVVLREGKHREVRRMMEAVGLMVSRLIRVRFGNVALPGFLKRGMLREMEEEQVQELLAFAGVNESEEKEEAGEEEEEDENDNIGNRYDPVAEARKRPPEPDDDIGNRYDPAREARMKPREIDDDIGNRGTYGEGFKPPKEKPQHGPRKAHGGGKPHGGKGFGFKKQRGPVNGNVAPQGERAPFAGGGAHAHGQPQPGGAQAPGRNKHKRRNKQGKAHGGQQGTHGQQQAHRGPPPQGGHQAQAEGGAPQPAGQGKPGRSRRHRNRHRNRGPQGGGSGAPQPGQE